MNCKFVLILLNLLLSTHTLLAANIIGYFTNWGIYGATPYTPEDVPYDKLTHIQYAFFKPEANGTISSFDTYADEQILLGKMIWTPVERHDSTTSLIYLAHTSNVRVLASIGGWTGSSNFPALAGSASTRSNFCSRAKMLLQKYNFDGIDIDWEYPCFSEHNGTAADAKNFVLLLAELRDTLDAMKGDKKLITLAIAGSSYHGKDFLVEQFHDHVDGISIMTYDYTGIWSSSAWHNSPLYDYGSNDNWSINRAMDYYKQRGVPASKLNIGIDFYGTTLAGCNGPLQPFTGAGSGEETGSLPYSTILENLENKTYRRYWDEKASVPYCLSTANEYCSYDDSASIQLKCAYCISKGYAGAILWELKGGMLQNGTQPLLNTVFSMLHPSITTVEKEKCVLQGKLRIQSIGSVPVIVCNFQKSSSVTLTLYSLSGKRVVRAQYELQSGPHKIIIPEIADLKSGKYLLKINHESIDYQTSVIIAK